MNVTFITETEYLQLTESPPITSRWRAIFAWITMVSFWLSIFIGFAFLEVSYTEDQLWRFEYTIEGPEWYVQIFIDLSMIIGFISFLLFLIIGILERFYLERRMTDRLRWIDLAIFSSWVYIPWCLDFFFEIGILFGFASFILAGVFLNRRRMSFIYLQAPTQKKLLFVMVLGSLFYMPIVDGAGSEITYALGIDTYSDREEGISESLQLEADQKRDEKDGEGASDKKDESEELIDGSSSSISLSPIFFMLTVCVIGPIAEEILFRGYLQTLFAHHVGRNWSIVVTALIFSLYHIDLPLFLPLFFSGIIFGIMRETFNSVWAASLLHIFMNAISSIGDIFP